MNEKGANHKNLKNRINRIEGQIKGINTMIESEKYCIDILTQIKAIKSALTGLGNEILENHLNHCVKDAIASGSQKKAEQKLEEIMDLIRRNGK